MPFYSFQHPETEEVKEIFFHMSDTKAYEEAGIQWKRIWTIPQASIDANIDPYSSQQFVESTGRKKGTYDDLLKRSEELSHKRAERTGKDPVKQKFYQDYTKARGGKHIHADQRKEIANEKLAKLGVSLD